MISIWRIFRNLTAISGFVMLICAAGTSDYYVMELGMSEPPYFVRNLVIGLVLLMPMMLQVLVDLARGNG